MQSDNNELMPCVFDSSFLRTIPEDASDTASNPPQLALMALSDIFNQQLLQRRTPASSVVSCSSDISIESSTGADLDDSVESCGRLSIASSNAKAVLLGGDTTDEDDVTSSPTSVRAGVGAQDKPSTSHRTGQHHHQQHSSTDLYNDSSRCSKEYWTRRRIYQAFAVSTLLVGVFAAIVGVVVVNNKRKITNATSNGPAATKQTTHTTSSLESVSEILNQTVVNISALWDDPNSYQYQAREWMLYKDTLRDTALLQGAARVKQRFALALLYFATGGPNGWRMNDNLTTAIAPIPLDFLNPLTTECDWTGVTCDDSARILGLNNYVAGSAKNGENNILNKVFRLYFHGMNLTGVIPAELGAIATLHEIDLSRNQLIGSIPDSIIDSWALKLNWLDLSENKLTGSIPLKVWSMQYLGYLFLNQNRLTGKIEQLKQVAVSSGTLDNQSLKQVRLYDNGLAGSLPTWFSDLQGLEHWIAFNNLLTGSIPDPPVSLTYFDVSHNNLTGTLPMSLWSLDTSPPLKELYLDHNQLSGPLPKTTQLGQAIQKIWLNDNHFSGEIPVDFAVGWKKLVELKVQNNNLTGLLGPPVQANNLAKTCPKIWPVLRKLVADCLERLVTVRPPVQCDCCTDCEGLRRL